MPLHRCSLARARVHGIALLSALLAACSTVPERRIVPEGFAPPGTPVDVRLVWQRERLTPVYDHTESGATGEVLDEVLKDPHLLSLLLLPVALLVDTGIAVSNRAHERQALRLAESFKSLPDRAGVEARLVESLRAGLGWIAPPPPAKDDSQQAAAAGGTTEPLLLVIAQDFSMRKDARAVLFGYVLAFCLPDAAGATPCVGDRLVEAIVLVHSDTLPKETNDAATRERLVAVIEEFYSLEGLEGDERRRQQRARNEALTAMRDQELSEQEAQMLAIHAWTREGGARLKVSFAAATEQLTQVVRVLRDQHGPPARNSMSVTRAVFPFFYDGELPVRDLDLAATAADGRRVLRARHEPMRFVAIDDVAANLWFSVPAARKRDTSAERALIEYFYARVARPR